MGASLALSLSKYSVTSSPEMSTSSRYDFRGARSFWLRDFHQSFSDCDSPCLLRGQWATQGTHAERELASTYL
jgi:hypothetical protein